ncbi:MAG: lysyl-tRNA synthetase, class [Thermoproteota archaeon]|nr:lysyl-tRNA synthetase, class [Thermoproteota archaeon]
MNYLEDAGASLQSQLVKHWSEVIAETVIEKKKEPFVVASAITTSGPSHVGTMCEFLYPSALVKYFKDEGYKVDFIFIGDIMDAFDGLPKSLERFSFLNEYLGKPLFTVPDPFECCESYGDHYLNEVRDLMKDLEVSVRILKANELVKSGKYDSYATLYHNKLENVKEVAQNVAKMSGSPNLPSWVDIIMPVCENCGRIATTRVKEFDGQFLRYVDDKNVEYVKGCGYEGEMKISDHKYKLFWRLDWPSRQAFLNVAVELAGADHHASGGSWDTATMIHREVLEREPPVSRRFGLVLLHGKKYSKSVGIGLSLQELLTLVPPPLVKYKLFKPDIEENKEFDPSGNELMKLYDEYQKAADLYETEGNLRRAENKMVLAYSLSTDKRRWRGDFAEILTQYQIFNDWSKVAERAGDKEGVEYLKKYIENWIKQEYLPEEYVFKFSPKRVDTLNAEILEFAELLEDSMTAEDVHNLVYSLAKERSIKTSKLFNALYLSLISKDHGPRFGRLVAALGAGQIKETLLKLYES